MNQRLRDLREDKDLTQEQVAALLHIHQTTYSDYELGKLNIPVTVLVKLSEFYQVSVDYLLELTDRQDPYPRKWR